MAKKWPGMVVQRSFIKEDSFVYRLYNWNTSNFELSISEVVKTYFPNLNDMIFI